MAHKKWQGAVMKIDKTTDRLYTAVAAWLKKNGGSGLVASGVEVIFHNPENKRRFTVGVKILGAPPTPPQSGVEKEEKPHKHRWVSRGYDQGQMCADCGVDLDDVPEDQQ